MTATNKGKKELSSVKGMRDILDEQYYYFQGFFEKAQEIAIYYGFKPIEMPIMEHEDIFTTTVGAGTDIVDKEMYSLRTKGGDHLALRPEGTAGVVRAYIEHGMQSLPQPVMLYYYGPFFRHDNPQKGRYRQFYQFGLEILGTEKSIADALMIKTFTCIVEEAGAKNLVVDVNSIGDKECRPKYIRELTNYYKKHINTICNNCKQRLKTNPMRLLDCKDAKCQVIKDNAPESISYLCPPCKHHFKEVLEYLEEMNINYRLNKNLVRGLGYYTRTVFEVAEETTDGTTPLALGGGGRYDYLARFLGGKKDIPAAGCAMGVDRIVESDWYCKLSPRIIKKPKMAFIQLGFEAKLKSINVIEILRKAKIPIWQSLSKDSLSMQLAAVEEKNIQYVIIFGQKEAIEKSVIVRDMSTRSQDTVPLSKLLEYLKELK